MTSDSEYRKTLIPVIRKKIVDAMIADIIGVQPMKSDISKIFDLRNNAVSVENVPHVHKHIPDFIFRENMQCVMCQTIMVEGSAIRPANGRTCRSGCCSLENRVLKADEVEIIQVMKCPKCGHSEE